MSISWNYNEGDPPNWAYFDEGVTFLIPVDAYIQCNIQKKRHEYLPKFRKIDKIQF